MGERESADILGFCLALEEGFDGFVLFVELGQVGDKIFDDVGVRKGVDAGFMLGICWDTACFIVISIFPPSMLHLMALLFRGFVTYTGTPAY